MHKSYFFYCLFILFNSCNEIHPNGEVKDFHVGSKNVHKFNGFTITTPANWHTNKTQGKPIDYEQHIFTNDTDFITILIGTHIPFIGDEDTSIYYMAIDTINGMRANVIIPKPGKKGNIGLNIYHIEESNPYTFKTKVIVYTSPTFNPKIFLGILKTLCYTKSDTLNNPPLYSSKFKYSPNESAGFCFNQYCKPCHDVDRNIVGPSFSSIRGKRSVQWIQAYLTNRKLVLNPKRTKPRNEVNCPEIHDLNPDQIRILIDIIK